MRAGIRTIGALLLVMIAVSCGKDGTAPVSGGKRVLFVGNSLTAINDLPATVAAIAKSAGDTFHVTNATVPGIALIDHLNGSSPALTHLRSSKWDYVVLQQGPTTTSLGRDSLVIWTEMFDSVIRAAGAQPALFMVWPADSAWDKMHLVRESYAAAAAAVNGIFLPGGEAWRIAHQQNPGLVLYGPDQFHPTQIGSFLAALVIYEKLSGRDARTLPHKAYGNGRELDLPAATIDLLQEYAHAAATMTTGF